MLSHAELKRIAERLVDFKHRLADEPGAASYIACKNIAIYSDFTDYEGENARLQQTINGVLQQLQQFGKHYGPDHHDAGDRGEPVLSAVDEIPVPDADSNAASINQTAFPLLSGPSDNVPSNQGSPGRMSALHKASLLGIKARVAALLQGGARINEVRSFRMH
jgi:hypothetical protein